MWECELQRECKCVNVSDIVTACVSMGELKEADLWDSDVGEFHKPVPWTRYITKCKKNFPLSFIYVIYMHKYLFNTLCWCMFIIIVYWSPQYTAVYCSFVRVMGVATMTEHSRTYLNQSKEFALCGKTKWLVQISESQTAYVAPPMFCFTRVHSSFSSDRTAETQALQRMGNFHREETPRSCSFTLIYSAQASSQVAHKST